MTSSHPTRLAPAIIPFTGVLVVAVVTGAAGAALVPAVAAGIAVYVLGYVVGSLLLDPVDAERPLSLAVIRTAAGLLLSTVSFLLGLVLALPWFIGPGALVAAALLLKRGTAVVWAGGPVRFDRHGVAAGVLVAILVSPIVISVLYMAPGEFPPVFYNIDTAYHLEKVHALVAAETYPPESLSNAGIRRTYHYGTQAMAALITRSSGLLPHHAMFLIVLPLLTIGVIAAAIATARQLAPALPRSLTVPLLLVSVPSLSIPFWDKFSAQLWTAAASGFSLDQVVGEYGLWGILSNEGPNVGGDFLVLSSVAGIAAAPAWGWRLPAFLIGTGILVKTPAGIALVAGFLLVEAWRGITTRSFRPSRQLVMAGTIFAVTAGMLFLVSFESNFRVELSPLFHLQQLLGRGHLGWVAIDVAWLLLPVLIVATAKADDSERRSIPILLLGVAPLLVVNATRMDNTRAGGGGTGDDWFQILHAVPFLMHAFAISVVSRRWQRLGLRRRGAVLLALALVVAPVTIAAAHYSLRLLREPESGNDFVDNRALASALAAIPTSGTVVVTNDLRYPAGHFTRDYRQMQIPALFGHQAFAVNYAHEAVEERRELQLLLQQSAWTNAIPDAARMYGWTHLLIRRDYMHPDPIPLEQVFENEAYAVFRFP